MSSRATFQVVYDGPALASHEMDVRDLAPALIAISDLLERANEALNGNKSKVAVSVNASFIRGSFGVDLTVVQQGLHALTSFINNGDVVTAKSLLEWLGLLGPASVGLFRLVKWVRGRCVRRVEPVPGRAVRIFIEDESLEVSEEVLKLFQDVRTREALESAVTKPLECEGISSFAAGTGKDKNSTVVVTKDEALHFRLPPREDMELGETERQMSLQLRGVNFKDGNKWLVYDGASEFYVAIADKHFIEQVNSHQLAFSKHDILVADVRERQFQTAKGLRTERIILRVVKHIQAAKQIQLPFDE